MSDRRVLVISHDRVGRNMAGPGIRYRELARVLAGHFQVTLAVPGQVDPGGALPFALWPYRRSNWDSLAAAARQADVIIAPGDSLAEFPPLSSLSTPLVVDGYDPHTLETLAMCADEAPHVQAVYHRARQDILRRQCQAADFIICASERQRDWWLGVLDDHGRVNSRTYAADPSLRRLVDVVPFGLPSDPPRAPQPALRGVWPGVGPQDRIVLWGGGLWEWLDPLTGLRAVRRLADRGCNVRLVFPGTRHPNPALPDMPMRARAIALADELGLTGRYAFFGDWVPHEDWPAVLLEADVGLSLHPDTVEARLAYRSRVLDYIWAGLPMVVTRGDAISEMVRDQGLGRVVDYQDDAGVAEAISALLAQPRSAWGERFEPAQAGMTWEQVAQPLVDFCRDPRPAADRRLVKGYPEPEKVPERIGPTPGPEELSRRVASLKWYHTVDLGQGIVTPGIYDHRPYLYHYGLPDDLTGKTALDVGAASGFFAFEMERRGAKVTAVDLPTWLDHDFGPRYEPDMAFDEALRYLHEPILLAREALGSHIDRIETSVYDLSPETVGMYDLVFCGSLLLHLTDPIRALWQIRSVTREQAIIATAIDPQGGDSPLASFVGHHRGDVWWLPNRAALEAMVQSAGFSGYEWVSAFRLDYRDGQPGPYHGVIRAWNTEARPDLPQPEQGSSASVAAEDTVAALHQEVAGRDAEIAHLRDLVAAYERGRFMRLMAWLRQTFKSGV